MEKNIAKLIVRTSKSKRRINMVNLATTAQRKVMQKLHIMYDPETCTVGQARMLIMEHNAKKGKVDVYSNLAFTSKKDLKRFEKLRQESCI